jgi:lysozyme family protein
VLKKALAVAIGAVLVVGGTVAVANQTSDVQAKLGVTADGVMGPQTKRAIKRFQRAHGLVVDGVVGPRTLAALGLRAKTASRTRSSSSSVLERIAQCESGGDPTAVSNTGQYRGKYQFDRSTWAAVGGKGDPAAAPEAEQDRRAALLLARQGRSAWPNCA